MSENILVRFEGGLGDCLLGNRFLFAVKEKYPKSKIKVAFDTGKNKKQETLLRFLWPSVYTDTYTIGDKLSNNYICKNLQNKNVMYLEHPDNLPSKFKDDIDSADIYFDLHVASLKFLRYDIPWQKYYYFFPKPEVIKKYENPLPNKFILVHLYPRPDSFHSLDQDYSVNLIKKLQNILPVVVICQKEYFNWYKNCSDWVIDPSVEEIFDIASRCEIFFGADSSIRYIPLHLGKPSFVLSKHCTEPFNINAVSLAHLTRWSIFRDKILPANCDPSVIFNICKNYLHYKGYFLFPEASQNLEFALGDMLLP
jgi:hypothetical protein